LGCLLLVPDLIFVYKVADVEAIIAAQGATLKYLPPYSPDLNLIEHLIAKIKALLRKAAERNVDQLWQTLAKMLDEIQAEECRNYVENAGMFLRKRLSPSTASTSSRQASSTTRVVPLKGVCG
jgi:hypothetical protein